jgi:hypothetical protein
MVSLHGNWISLLLSILAFVGFFIGDGIWLLWVEQPVNMTVNRTPMVIRIRKNLLTVTASKLRSPLTVRVTREAQPSIVGRAESSARVG